MITGLLSDLDLSRFDIEQTRDNIEASWLLKEGLVFPLVDNGVLLTRSYPQLKIEDFVGAFYVKTIFNQIFVEAGIKIQGELLSDWMFLNAISLKNSKSQEEIDARSSYVQKTTDQPNIQSIPVLITWDNDSQFPFYDGSQDNFKLPLNLYQADLNMVLDIEVSLNLIVEILYSSGARNIIYLYVNGVEVDRTERPPTTGIPFGTEEVFGTNFKVKVNQGDQVDIRASATYASSGFGFNVVSGSVKIIPSYVYKSFGKSSVPNWTKQQFVSNILRMFNVLASYEEGNHTLTLNLFEKIKSKPAIDLSEYISETEVEYSEFISDYGKNSRFSYNEVEFEELKTYNSGKFFKYGQGIIRVNNDFLEDNVNIIESDFSNPIAYINGIFDMSIERTNLIELEEGEEVDIVSVSDASGNARFNIAEDIFLVGDLVRIQDSTDPSYNGDWRVSAVAAGWFELLGTAYGTNATGTATKLNYVYDNSDDVYLLINVPNYDVDKFSNNTFFFVEGNGFSSMALAYFDIINTNNQVNEDFIYSLSFGGIDDPSHYMITMIEQYFRLFSQILNDPVKILSTCHIPYALFVQIDFLSPIKIRTLETTNEYYLNRISGYKESYLPCTLELIKI